MDYAAEINSLKSDVKVLEKRLDEAIQNKDKENELFIKQRITSYFYRSL